MARRDSRGEPLSRREYQRQKNQQQEAQNRYKKQHDEEETYERTPERDFEYRNQRPVQNSSQRPRYENQSSYEKSRKPKRRRRHHFFRNLLLLFILIFGLCFWRYQAGVKEATEKLGEKTPVETFNGVKSADGSTNILLVGSDQRPQENQPSRSDTIMILHLGKHQKKPKLVSIMRDTYVTIPGHGKNKINAAYAYGGAELLRQTLKENFNLDTRYYVRVDFSSFEEVIDALYPKGVKINAEKAINLDGVTINPGEQKMEGHVLLQYARFRKDEESDFGRIRRQQQVIDALIQQAKNPATLLHLPKAMGAAMTYTSTNLPTSYALGQGISYLFKGAKGVDRLAIPVENSWQYGNYPDAGSVLEINFEKNQQSLADFFAA